MSRSRRLRSHQTILRRRRVDRSRNQPLVLPTLNLLRTRWKVREVGLPQQRVGHLVVWRSRNGCRRSSVDRYRVRSWPSLKMSLNLAKDTHLRRRRSRTSLRSRTQNSLSPSLVLRSSWLLLGAPYSYRTNSLALSRSLHYNLRGGWRGGWKLSLASVELRNVQPAERVLPESQKERDRTITQGCNPSPDSLAETGREAALPDAGGDRNDEGENPANGQHRADPGVAADGFGCRPLGRHLTDGIRGTGPSR